MVENIDYSKSAVNLENSLDHIPALTNLAGITKLLEIKRAELATMAIGQEIAKLEAEFERVRDEIKRNIDQFGSYQDIEKGIYAVKQRRVKPIYSPDLLRQHVPDIAEEAIHEIVDDEMLDKLRKEKLITAKQLEQCVEREKELSFAFIIKTNNVGRISYVCN